MLMFMPWTRLHRTPLDFGRFRLIGYHRGREPEGGLSGIPLDAIDKVLDAYSARRLVSTDGALRPVDEAVLFDWRDEPAPDDWDASFLNARFALADLVRFAAVTAREVGNSWDYCNASDVQVIVQRVHLEDPNPVVFLGRARGRSVLHHASRINGAPIFVRPWQSSSGVLKLDEALLSALLAMENPDLQDRVGESIACYLSANTDSDDVPLSAELVLLRMAMDRLLGCDMRASQFREALRTHFGADLPATPNWGQGPIDEAKWRARWPDSKQKEVLVTRPLDAWAHDFCNARNSCAHAGAKPSKHADSVMALEAHALFASWLIPLLVKGELVKESIYRFSNEDRAMRRGMESLLSWDLLARAGSDDLRFASLVDELKQEAIQMDLLDAMTRPA